MKSYEKEVIKIEKPGMFGDKTKKEFKNELKWEELLKKESEAKNEEQWLRSRIKMANFEQNLDVARLLEFIRQKHLEFQKIGVVALKRFRGAKNIQIIREPERIMVIKYQRKGKDGISDKNLEPTEQRFIFEKYELNAIISAVNILKNRLNNDLIKTEWIAEEYCRILGIKESIRKQNLFDEKDRFIYSNFIRGRMDHYRLTLLLNILEDSKVINYNKGMTKVLKDKIEIQEVLY